jgi:hypothetical protein
MVRLQGMRQAAQCTAPDTHVSRKAKGRGDRKGRDGKGTG